MKNPAPINLLTSDQVREQGCIAEARDDDGHLCSTQAWLDRLGLNDNLRMLGEFIADYQDDRIVNVFDDLLAEKLAAWTAKVDVGVSHV